MFMLFSHEVQWLFSRVSKNKSFVEHAAVMPTFHRFQLCPQSAAVMDEFPHGMDLVISQSTAVHFRALQFQYFQVRSQGPQSSPLAVFSPAVNRNQPQSSRSHAHLPENRSATSMNHCPLSTFHDSA